MRKINISVLATLILSSPSSTLADGELPAMLIRIPESVTTLFIAETTTAEFHRFHRGPDGILQSGSYYMSIGEQGPGKDVSGDKRTPLGAYFVTEQLDTSKLHEKYGVTAFPLDYPNAWDQRAGRDGDGIWVHGVHPAGGKRPERDTDGCIALPNEDLSALLDDFESNVTPVLVTRKVSWVAATETDLIREALEQNITLWARSQTQGDVYSYLSLYDDSFVRWGLNKAEWSALVLRNMDQHDAGDQVLGVSDLLLLAYPEEDGIFFSRFQITETTGMRETRRMARLYWRRDESGAFRIVAEDNG